MQREEIKTVVAETLAEQKRLHNNDVDEVVLRAISTILTSFGIEEEDRIELRQDFIHLRRWRKATEQIEKASWRAVVTIAITGVCGLIWLGLQAKFGKWP